jgi:serine/threonine protein kinase
MLPVNNKYILINQIGQGNFGTAYKGINRKTKELVAIKIEHSNSPAKILKHETTILNYLYRNGCRSAPPVYWFGQYIKQPCLVMQFYECSLLDYSTKQKLSTNKINAIMLNMFDILENIHTHFVIHRDIKPHNFMIQSDKLYIIDFGLAALYTNEKGEHLPHQTDKECIIGTPTYISINVHNGEMPTRRDDIISSLYIWFLLTFGYLPWTNIPDKISVANDSVTELHISHYKNQIRKQMKNLHLLDNELRNAIVPRKEEISENNYMYNSFKYAYQMNYQETPDYVKLKQYIISEGVSSVFI